MRLERTCNLVGPSFPSGTDAVSLTVGHPGGRGGYPIGQAYRRELVHLQGDREYGDHGGGSKERS